MGEGSEGGHYRVKKSFPGVVQDGVSETWTTRDRDFVGRGSMGVPSVGAEETSETSLQRKGIDLT